MAPSSVGVHPSNKRISKTVVGPGRGQARKCAPKKGGHGGWGKAGEELADLGAAIEDEDEIPPFDLKEIASILSTEEIETYLTPRMEEFFVNGLSEEFALSCNAIPTTQRAVVAEFVIRLGIDQNENERELASQLISDLFGYNILTLHDIERAFEQLAANVTDLKLDTPNATEVLAKFMARCVADDCLPPIFVNSRAGHGTEGSGEAAAAFSNAHTLITMKHGLSRLDSVWGQSGCRRPVKFIINRMVTILDEYLAAVDVPEVERCLHELGVPHFHHELVYEAVSLALDKGPDAQERLSDLLLALHTSNVVTPNQMEAGFKRIFGNIDDIELDSPNAADTLDLFIESAIAKGFLLASFVVKGTPKQGRKRFLSENDGGRCKE